MESAFRSIGIRLLVALLVLALSVGAFAQGGSGELSGLITDPSGAVAAGVDVKLSNTATGEVRTTVTTPAGTYRFPALPVVGTYTLEISPKGFKSVKVQNIIMTVGTIVNRDVKLEMGTTTEQVTVEAGAQLVQSTDASLSQDVDRRVWQDMPLETRSQNEFIGLLAGAEPAANAGLTTDRGAAVNGTRSGTGNFMVEGFDNNDQGQGGGGSPGTGSGGANTTISPDAIEEYRVIEHIPAAEYGKAGGFVTDTVLKSGTNQWHGSLFEYNRVQALAANSWFSNNSLTKDRLVRNQFGGSVGGPIVRDKSFFYFTAEAHRLRTASPLSASTITSNFVNFVQTGAFQTFMESDPNGFCMKAFGSACTGAFAQDATTGPLWQKIYAAEPLPLCATGQANCTNLTNIAQSLYPALKVAQVTGEPLQYPVDIYGTINVPQPQSVNQMRYTTKFDQKVGSKDQFNAAYLYDNADTTTAFAGNNVMGPSQIVHLRAQNVGVTWSHTFSPSILNQARAAYVRHTGNFPNDPRVVGMPAIITFWDSPTFGFGNSPSYPQFFTDNEFVYKDDLSVTKGKHNFKGGGEYRRTRNGSSFDSFKFGYLLPQGTEDLLTDVTFSQIADSLWYGAPHYGSLALAEASLDPTTGQLPEYYRGYRANEAAAYIQDDWRVVPRLTVNLGLRWEYFGPPHNFKKGIDANFYTGVNTTPAPTLSTNPFFPLNSPLYASIATGVVQQRDHAIWNKDLNNFGPRIGFAYDALGNSKLVVRGGFGINYDRIFNNIFENIRFNPPNFAIGLLGRFGSGVTIAPAETTALYTYPFTGTSTFAGAGLTPSLRAMDQNLVTPYYEQAHLGVQYQLAKDFVLESNYVGTFGHKLLGVLGMNTFDGRFVDDNTPVNPLYSNISFRTNCCSSNYHGWQTTVRKRFSGGLQFNANYTFSKGMDDISDTFTTKNASLAAYPTDSMNPRFDYGPADYDVRHRVVASFVYDLPFARSNRWIGGWNVSGIVSVQSGANFSVNNSTVDSNGDNQFNDRANYIGSGKITNATNHHASPATGYLNPSDWGMLNADIPCPASVNMGLWCEGQSLGQMERNTLTGPGFFNTDFGVKKTFKITERASLRVEGNFFNIFNHPNFLAPDANLNNSSFGKSLSTFSNEQSGGPRITQLAVRFDF
jgi:hypothetical protein